MNLPERPTDQDNEYVFDVEGFTGPSWVGAIALATIAFWLGAFLALLVWAL